MSATKPRLSAEQRRAAVLECACGIFSKGSYRGTTTAEIARRAGVTEPILYRHFQSKRDLYLACLDSAWVDTRRMWEQAVAAEPDPALWLTAMGAAYQMRPPVASSDSWKPTSHRTLGATRSMISAASPSADVAWARLPASRPTTIAPAMSAARTTDGLAPVRST